MLKIVTFLPFTNRFQIESTNFCFNCFFTNENTINNFCFNCFLLVKDYLRHKLDILIYNLIFEKKCLSKYL